MAHEEPGRGRKQCPGCSKYVGARCRTCDCGHEFGLTQTRAAVKRSPVAAPVEITPRMDCFVRIWVPAGKCPVKLESADREQVVAWATKTVEACRTKGQDLTTNALIYYAKQFFDWQSPDYRAVRGVLEAMTLGVSQQEMSRVNAFLTDSDTYWEVVSECLVEFHEFSAQEAQEKVGELRDDPDCERLDVPFNMACELAGQYDPLNNEYLLKKHRLRYNTILSQQA